MIKRIKQMILTTMAMAALVSPFVLAPVAAHAETFELQSSLCGGVDGQFLNADGTCENNQEAGQQVNDTVKLGLNLFSAIVGIIAVVMIIVGGVKYITSQGESSNVTAAKNTILYAVVGLVVVALSQVIVRFVLSRFITN